MTAENLFVVVLEVVEEAGHLLRAMVSTLVSAAEWETKRGKR